MIIEGFINPANGTQFTVLQSEITDPLTALHDTALQTHPENSTFVVTMAIPNPLEFEFDQLVLSPEEVEDKRQAAIDEIRRLLEGYGDDTQE